MFSRRRLRGAQSSLAARAATGGLVLATGLTACGGSGDQGGSGAVQAVQGAYEKTTAAETVKIALKGKQQGAQKSGGNQQGKQRSISGEAALDFEQNASSTTVNSGGSNSETRTIDDILYRKVPEQQRATVPGKKPWIKVDLAKIAKAQYGNKAAQMLDNPPSDPAGMLGYLRGVTQAEEAGTSTVRGAETTHYKAKVDLKKAAKGQGPQIAQRLQQLGKQLGNRPLAIQVWLDQQERVRRLKTTLPSAGQSGGGGGLVLTEEFYDYDAPVQVNPPAKGKTASVTKQILAQQKMRQQMQQRQRQQQQQSSPRPTQS